MSFEERISGEVKSPWFYEHIARYEFASKMDLGNKILDVACGNGIGSRILFDTKNEVHGVDIDITTILENANRYTPEGLHFHEGDAQKLDFEDNFFSSAVSFETIEHLNYPQVFLGELSRVVIRDGLILISTPNALETKPIDGVPKNPWHVKEFTPEELIEILSSKFEIVKVLGQKVSDDFKFNYFWERKKFRFLQPSYYIWYSLHRLHSRNPDLADSLAHLILTTDIYPDSNKWIFTNEQVHECHDLLIVCKNSIKND